MESSKATLTLERICDMATLSQDSVELLSNILGMNTEELYRTDVVMIGKVTSEETGFYQYPRFLIAKDREMKEVLTEAYVHRDTEGTFYAFLESNMLPWAKLIIAPWLIIIMAITDVRDCWTMYWAEIRVANVTVK